MTRLNEQWIYEIRHSIAEYERALYAKTGLDFAGLAARAGGVSLERVREKTAASWVAVVPMTSGGGVIGGFCDVVAAILRQAGASAFTTESADVAGISEAYAGADIIFMADDNKYIAVDVQTRRVVDNNQATACGFVEALEAMSGTLAAKEVLILGCGVIGRLGAERLLEKSAVPVLWDKAADVLESACLETGAQPMAGSISDYDYILDATNEGGWLKKDMLRQRVWIAAPGVPLSLDREAAAALEPRLIHDILHIGTLAMLGALC